MQLNINTRHFSPRVCREVLQCLAEFLPSLLSLMANDGAYALLCEMVIKWVWEQLREETERGRERESERFVPHLPSWETPHVRYSTVCSALCVCVCVCVCVWTQHVPTKLVYHQLCSGARSVPASVQYFFQLPPPNGGSGRFYCATLGRLLWPDPEHLALCGLNVLWLWT